MPTFLFWNINRKPLAERVARIVKTHSVDVVMLAESELSNIEVRLEFENLGLSGFVPLTPLNGSIRLYHRTPWEWDNRHDGEHWQVFRIRGKPFRKALVAIAHLRSKLRAGPADQESHARKLVQTVRHWENRLSIDRTFLVGDLNMNPFVRGIVGANELHAVMTRTKAEELTRRYDEEDYPFFYNPMWGLFGDRTTGPAGTYYSGPRGAVSFFWEMFDQLLLRPSLASGLSDLMILDNDGGGSLLSKNGIPDTINGSDHLPLLFHHSMI